MSARAYYNDIDPKACAWLRELIKAGLIAPGDVDSRSILEIQPDDLKGYTQCHFFAGIGGWSYALRLAGWPDDRPVWTGSCPCQPLSSAGQGRGHADERHLWPAFYSLIAECRPAVTFGEQVASKLGREWFCGVRADLEGLGYACGAADLPAASCGAPHKRNRLFWVADTPGPRQGASWGERSDSSRNTGSYSDNDNRGGGLGDSDREGLGERKKRDGGPEGGEQASCGADPVRPGDFWGDSRLILCRDGKARRVPTEPSLFPLAPGLPGRVGLLRGAGNAIVPQVAAEFVRAWDSLKRPSPVE